VRVLFSSTSGYGHIFPMVPLARAFAAHGHAVRWATGRDSCPIVAAAGLDVVAAGLSGDLLAVHKQRVRALGTGLRPEDRSGFVFPLNFGHGRTPAMVADLLPVARVWQPDLLVHEQGELAAPLVGAVLGVPTVLHAFGGSVPAELLSAAGDQLAPLWSEHGLTIPPYAGCNGTTYLDICPTKVQTVSLRHVVGVLQELRPVSYTGEPTAEPPSGIGDDSVPLVYVTLGTVSNKAAAIRAAVQGLSGLGVRLLVTVGPDGDPEALGEQPSHVTVERYVSQTEVLPHCAAVISHGGSGTFFGALGQGLPHLCLPQGADQFRNAAGAVQSGVGLALHPDEATPEAIAHAASRILTEGSFRAAAVGLADDIRAMPSPDEVVSVLERLG
jgi:UDP:flavonoid glycosyltransferase YjiC (YdhE family)